MAVTNAFCMHAGRPNITAYWNQVMKTNNFTALLYPQGNMDSPYAPPPALPPLCEVAGIPHSEAFARVPPAHK